MIGRPIGRRLTLALLALVLGCGDDDVPAPAPPGPPPWDDDSGRLGHCEFEPAPPRAPLPASEPTPIRAGYGAAPLILPIGTPLGGYGDRLLALGGGEPPDDRAARWAKGMTPTVGVHDTPMAEALAIEAGGERAVIVRIDAPLLTEDALFALEAALAADGSMRGRVLATASHSHAAWAAWQPTLYLTPGVDRPRRDLFDRVVGAMAQAAQAALEDLVDARIGFAVDPAFDPADTVTTDRRGENDAVVGPDGNHAGAGKDPVMWAMRVDRADGTPLAALVNLPIHGTVGEAANPLVSTDVPGAIARALSSELGYPVLHLQGAAGDVTPADAKGRDACPDATRCLDIPALEVLGARATALVAPEVRAIATEELATLEVVTRTFPIGRGGVVERPDGRQLWYLPPDPNYQPDGVLLDASGHAAVPFDEFNTIGGAGLCGDATAGSIAPIPNTSGVGPYSSCVDLDGGAEIILGLFDLDFSALPLCDTVRATGAALRFGLSSGDWLLVGIPGEPTAPFAEYLRSRSPAGRERTLLVGYADEYTGYVLTAEDWLAGGYECSTSLWGPREGEQILDGLLAAVDLAWTTEREDPEAGTSRNTSWTWPTHTEIGGVVTTDHGSALTGAPTLWWPDTSESAQSVDLAAPVSRAVGLARFAWAGGDPAVDFPEVVVEREVTPGMFEPLLDGGGNPASSRAGAVVVTYTPDPLTAEEPSRHLYAASWQPTAPDPFTLAAPGGPYSLPLGRYRLVARGSARGERGQERYQVVSTAFEVIAASLDAMSSSAVRGAAELVITARTGSAPGLRALREGSSDVDVPLVGPWMVTVVFTDTTSVSVRVPSTDGVGKVSLSAAQLAAVVSVDVRDPFGNGGALTVE